MEDREAAGRVARTGSLSSDFVLRLPWPHFAGLGLGGRTVCLIKSSTLSADVAFVFSRVFGLTCSRLGPKTSVSGKTSLHLIFSNRHGNLELRVHLQKLAVRIY